MYTEQELQELYKQYQSFEWEELNGPFDFHDVEEMKFSTPTKGPFIKFICHGWTYEQFKEQMNPPAPKPKEELNPIWEEGFQDGYGVGYEEGEGNDNPYPIGSKEYSLYEDGYEVGYISGALDR